MNILKITNPVVNYVGTLSRSTKINSSNVDTSNPQKLASTLDCMAASAIPSIVNKARIIELPEFIYHITSKENYEKILKDGKMKISSCEGNSVNGCKGIYFVDKDNFLNKWVGRKEPELFGSDTFDVGELLMIWTCKSTNGTVAIKIPTDQLDKSQLRFRPYLIALKEAIETLNPETNIVESKMVKEGLPIEDLSKYVNSEPVEYVYFGEITSDMFSGYTETTFSENMGEMIDKLFR